jgi:hypothetical protein
MSRFQKIAMAIFLLSLSASVAASHFYTSSAALWLGVPALIMSAWSALGHLATIDDDYPGEFSNPEKLPLIWHTSLVELVLKLTVLLVTAWLVVLVPT